MYEGRGQTAVEYLLVFSTALLLIASVGLGQMINPATEAMNDALFLSQGRFAAMAIAEAIDTVYFEGPGASTAVGIKIDVGWAMGLDNSTNRVWVSVWTSGGIENLRENLVYGVENLHTLPQLSAGAYVVLVEWPSENVLAESLTLDLEEKKIHLVLSPPRR